MADVKRPPTQRMGVPRPADYAEADTTVPSGAYRAPPPRIALPLGQKPGPAPAPLPASAPARAPTPAPVRAPAPAAPPELIQLHRFPVSESLDPRLILTRAPDSPAAASFRVLRHRLVERPGLRVVLVTSPEGGEGKTTVALNLALALGESGRARVLLLEANLRRPALARLLGFRPPVCFGEQLEFHRTHPQQPWVVVENVSAHLHTAAVLPDAPSRAIVDGPAVAIALEQLRTSSYDYIVLDSPPVLGSADVNLLAEHVDGILFALRARRSRARALRRAVDQLGSSRVVGSVLLG